MEIINRQEILDNAKNESELSDLKQHADKMIRGFENFNNFSSNRAVWELVQNACDLSKKCEVVIDYSNEGFAFSHNGAPFTTNALISLIKQVSGKYGNESEMPEVGKYGTGFLTTHTFGRKFYINSILEANGVFFDIKDFLIDRSPKEWKKLSENIKVQKDNVYKLIEEGLVISTPVCKTTFKFIPETPQELSYISESYKDLEAYIPIVLTISDRLNKVTIIKNDLISTFEQINKEEVESTQAICLFKTTISRNGQETVLFSIIDNEDQIEIILPIDDKLELFHFPERVARLFLYYPLIGSETFGINFIINCKKFLPTEPRDGVHLKSNKDQVKDQEDENRRIVEKASDLIFNFLKSNILSVSNPLLYAKINFKRDSENTLLNEYFEKLQHIWTEQFKVLPIVETSEGFKSVNELYYLDEDLLKNIDCFDEIYELAFTFYQNIPVKEKIVLWSKYVSEWTSDRHDFIGHEDLVKAISKEHLYKFNKGHLLKYYETLVQEGRINLFSEYSLLPNLDGKFYILTSLLLSKDLTTTLIEIGKVLIPNSIEKLVNPDFCFTFQFERFSRKNYSTVVKSSLDEMQACNMIYLPESINLENYNDLTTLKEKKLSDDFFVSFLKYCKLNNNIDSKSKPVALIKIISKYYSFDENLIHLASLEVKDENLDTRTVRKILVQIFFNLVQHHTTEWVKVNIPLLLSIANCNEDSIKEAFLDAKIYPNQNNFLKPSSVLKRDDGVFDEFKTIYRKITDRGIRTELVYKEFNEFILEDRVVTNKSLANQIEEIFFNTDINNINEHQFKSEILNIISKLRDKKYSGLFPRLDDKKATLMLAIVTNENTKDDIFSIVTLNENQINKLGKLVNKENFDAILNKATNLIQEQDENNSDFRHKHEIGTYIESIIREKLSAELQEKVSISHGDLLETSDVQGGQDIVIKFDDDPIYYIEVKSRWNPKNSVSMSKLQLQRAVEENERYSLCAVDITKYEGFNDKYYLPTHEILPLTKFVSNIGSNIKPLIEDNLVAEKKQEESIHLIDYRGIIPQEIIKNGNDFNKFIESLLCILNNITFNDAK